MFNATQHSVVFVCDLCGSREVTTTRAAAHNAATRHEMIAHPGIGQARNSASTHARRHTDL